MKSGLSLVASAGYPLIPLGMAPNIDYQTDFFFQAMPNDTVIVSWTYTHNLFPAYEIVINGNAVEAYHPTADGPDFILMNTNTVARGAVVIERPTDD